MTKPLRRAPREQLVFPGLGERILARLVELGYVTSGGAPNQARFIAAKRYPTPSFYFWTRNERTPSDLDIIERLAGDLGVSVCWLLLGPRGEREVIERHRPATNGRQRVYTRRAPG